MDKTSTHKQITVFSGAVLNDGKILMTLRDEKGCDGAHMKWELPGGKAEAGENAEEAVLREIFEETGVRAEVTGVIPVVQTHHWDYEWGKQQTFCLYYLCDFISKENVPKDHRVSKCEWFSLDSAVSLECLPGTTEIIQHIVASQE